MLAAIVAIGFLASCDMIGGGGRGASDSAAVATRVGMMRIDYVDPARASWSEPDTPRPLRGWVWYPAAEEGTGEVFSVPVENPVFVGGVAIRNAEIAPGAHPLVLLSHGTGGSGFQMMWLGRRLAEAGFVAAAVDHHGNTAAEESFDPRGFLYMWERPQDLSVLIDSVLSDPRFAASVDPDRMGAAGFSLGGYTVVASLGARIDLDQFNAFCASEEADATCRPQPEYPEAMTELEKMIAEDPSLEAKEATRSASYRDPRIRVAAALAPALGQMMTDESLAEISAPLLIITGDADDVTPIATNARRIVDNVEGAVLDVAPGASHYTFLNTCTSRGRRFVPICKDPTGVDRAAAHDAAAARIAAFFKAALSEDGGFVER
ncbi:MAG: alpha/beta hydrolase [Pseudomonadota bacterium]